MEWQDDWMDAKLYWSMLPLHAALFFDKQRKRKDEWGHAHDRDEGS